MARISIDEIKKELESDGWKLISTVYKNLDSNLEYKCKEGHTVIAPWKKIRENHICPSCMRERLKTQDYKYKKKKEDYRILAIDQATHTSGYAIFNNKNLIDFGSFTTDETKNDIERSVQVKQWMISLIDQYQIDFVGLEGIQYQTQAGVTTFETLARLQGILAAACVEDKINYKIAHTAVWRESCGVKGKSRPDKKRSMQRLVKEWFGINASEDECDAIGIGKYFCDNQMPKIEIVDWENE